MKIEKTPLKDAYLVSMEHLEDSRGFFARAFCAKEFEEAGLKPTVAQANWSFNHRAGTLRGMHFQVAPAEETKLVRCVQGALLDVIVDLRPNSPTYLQHHGVELTSSNRQALYVPACFAHGYLTLADNTEVLYQVGEFYTPGAERGLRYNDPALRIEWPRSVEVISDKDASWAYLEEGATPLSS